MNEDHSGVREEQAPEKFAVLRPIALNLLTCACGKAQANRKKPQGRIPYQTAASRLEGRLSRESPRHRQLRCDCPNNHASLGVAVIPPTYGGITR